MPPLTDVLRSGTLWTAPWVKSELLCLLTVGTLVLGPQGAALVAGTVRPVTVQASLFRRHAIGRIVATQADPTGVFDVPDTLVDIEACGHTYTELVIKANHKGLKVGMLVPVTLGPARTEDEPFDMRPDLFGAHEPRPGEVYVAKCS